MSKNEEKNLSKGRRDVRAWRRHPDHPEWSVYVTYGDGGFESEPGTFGESKETALKDIDRAVKELEELKEWIEREL